MVRIVLVVLGVVVFTLAGLWVFAGLIAPGYWSSIGLGIAWFIVAAVLLGRFRKNRPELTWPVRGAFLVTAVVVSVFALLTSVRDRTVNETVVTGVPAAEISQQPPNQNLELAAGEFESAEEGSASGRAALVKVADGPVMLTITDLDVAAGPDLRVYLVPGDGEDMGDKLDLGGLKGNKGSQQYELPEDAETDLPRTVVVYCRAFSVAFGRAHLTAG